MKTKAVLHAKRWGGACVSVKRILICNGCPPSPLKAGLALLLGGRLVPRFAVWPGVASELGSRFGLGVRGLGGARGPGPPSPGAAGVD